MNIFSLASFLACLIYADFGVRILKRGDKQGLNRLFALLCASYAWWSLCYVFLYPAPTEEACRFWFRLSAFGWTQFSGLTLHFTMLLTGQTSLLRRKWFCAALYLPGFILLARALTGTVTAGCFEAGPLGWVPVIEKGNPWFWAFTAHYSCYVVMSIALTVRWGRRTSSVREKRQSNLIAVNTAVSLVLAAATNNILPALGIHALPSVGHIVILFWIGGIWIAISRYRLMTLTSGIAAEEILKKTREMILLLDTAQKIIRINPRTEKLLGYSAEELCGRHVNEIICSDRTEESASIAEKLVKMSSDSAPGFNFLSRKGELIPVSMTISRIRDSMGEPIGTVIFARDLLQSRQLQREIAERRLVESALSRSENQYRVIFENSGTVIVTIQSDATIRLVNSEFERVSGYTRDEVEGRRKWPDFVHPEDLPGLLEYDRSLTTDHAQRPHSCEVRLLDRQGKYRHVMLTSALVPDSEERIVSILDITLRKEAEQALVESHEKLKEIDRLKTDFLSIAAHELRTPLTSVLGFAKIIRSKFESIVCPVLPPENQRISRTTSLIRENLNIIVTESNRLTSLINDMLDLAKMEAGKVEWDIGPVSIPELIERTQAATSSLLAQKGLAFIVELDPDLPEVQGDLNRLIQVMINLVSNAVKFTDRGSVCCRVRRGPGRVTFSVVDTGIGLHQEHFARIFEKFRQVGDTLDGRQLGTGLGLPICRQIVERFGGSIWVESEIGRGSTFSFTLPVSGPGAPPSDGQ